MFRFAMARRSNGPVCHWINFEKLKARFPGHSRCTCRPYLATTALKPRPCLFCARGPVRDGEVCLTKSPAGACRRDVSDRFGIGAVTSSRFLLHGPAPCPEYDSATFENQL